MMFSGAIPQKAEGTDRKGFPELGLQAAITRRLEAISFRHPTPIQDRVIPPALGGRDIVGLAETGSGKTAAFVLPMIQCLQEGRGLRGLIVCPTREIALQNTAFLRTMGQGGTSLRAACLIGGVPLGPQVRELAGGADIAAVTPGRLLDHLGRGNVDLDGIEILVLDEADHMLDLGFLPQVYQILEAVPEERQTMMFSATMPAPVARLARRFMRDPLWIDILPTGRVPDGIEHRLYLVEDDQKKPCLLALAGEEPGSILVFVRRKVDADWACRQLELEGHPVDRMHSDRSQTDRVDALRGLREGEHRILVATDIAARGIDIPVIQHIVNFDVPQTVEDYIHRAGRTARGSAGGTVSTIATWQDRAMIREIEAALGEELPRYTTPGARPYRERKTTIRGRRKIRRRLL